MLVADGCVFVSRPRIVVCEDSAESGISPILCATWCAKARLVGIAARNGMSTDAPASTLTNHDTIEVLFVTVKRWKWYVAIEKATVRGSRGNGKRGGPLSETEF